MEPSIFEERSPINDSSPDSNSGDDEESKHQVEYVKMKADDAESDGDGGRQSISVDSVSVSDEDSDEHDSIEDRSIPDEGSDLEIEIAPWAFNFNAEKSVNFGKGLLPEEDR